MSNKSMTEHSFEQLANGVQGGYSFKPDGKVIEYVNSKFIEYEKDQFVNVDKIFTIDLSALAPYCTIDEEAIQMLFIASEYIGNFKRLVGKA